MGPKYWRNCLSLTLLVVMAKSSLTTAASAPISKRHVSEGQSGNLGNSVPAGQKEEPVVAAVSGQDTRTQADEVAPEDVTYEKFVYNPHIIINPPTFSAVLANKACCNCSAFRDVVASEMARLEEIYRRLREDTKRQLQELQSSVSDIAGLLTKLPDTKTNIRSAPTSTTQEPQTITVMPTPATTASKKNPTAPTTTTAASTTTTAAEAAATTAATAATTTTAAAPTEVATTTAEAALTTSANAATTPAAETTAATTNGEASAPIAKDCSEALSKGVKNSGVYMVQPVDSGNAIQVYCDMDTDGGGWTVFQRRQDGSVDFYRDFESYRQGFGSQDGEFWLGNDNLHRLTAQEDYELRVDLTDFLGNAVYARYNSFSVGDRSDSYRLRVGGYSGTSGDALISHNNKPFSTKDRDSDDSPASNCARQYRGAWWYERCHQSNLNGLYLGGATDQYGRGVVWRRWKGYRYSLKTSEMKFRKKQ